MGGGEAWISPVFYAVDTTYHFYWYSRKDTKHSRNISLHPYIAVVIFNSSPKENTGEAVYMQGKAQEVCDEQLAHATLIYASKAATNDENRKQLQTPEDFLNESPLRMYELTPETIYINDADSWNGKWIDKRIEISLK